MKLVHRSIRLPMSLDKTLQTLAERHHVSVYAMLQRSVNAGLATLARPPANEPAIHEIVGELASLGAHIVDVERMLDRTLFTACAAYCYARSAAQGARKSDEIITTEIKAAYERQRRLSHEDKS